MSMVTHSTLRKRDYQRKFDHEEAIRRYQKGETVYKLSNEFGISYSRMRTVVAGTRRKPRPKYTAPPMTKKCANPSCKKLVRDCTELCQRCSCYQRFETRDDVRPTTLRCHKCERWLPDDKFNNDKTRSRRFKHGICKDCKKSKYNSERHLCTNGCGREVSGASKSGRCRFCQEAHLGFWSGLVISSMKEMKS